MNDEIDWSLEALLEILEKDNDQSIRLDRLRRLKILDENNKLIIRQNDELTTAIDDFE